MIFDTNNTDMLQQSVIKMLTFSLWCFVSLDTSLEAEEGSLEFAAPFS